MKATFPLTSFNMVSCAAEIPTTGLMLLAREIHNDGVEVRVAELCLAEHGHDTDAVPHNVLHKVGCEISTLFQGSRRLPVILVSECSGSGMRRSRGVADGTAVLELHVSDR